MEKVTSFTINHLKLKPGIYVSRIDHVNGNPLTTFDLRMTTPNKEPVMNLPMANYLAKKYLTEVLDHITDDRLVYPE